MAEEMQQDEGFEQAQNGNTEMTEESEEDKAPQQIEDDEEDEDDRKIFVGGLSQDAEERELKGYFEAFGEVTKVTLKRYMNSKKSRGFGFVLFATSDSVDKVIAEKEHKINKRTIDLKKANPRPVNKKIYVGRLDPKTSEEDVRTYFETHFGTVEKIERPYDKQKEQRRAFCFVEFKKLSAMKKCLEQNAPHKIGGMEVDVKRATPPEGETARGGPRGRGFGPGGRGGRGGGYPGGYGGYPGGYGYGPYPGYDQGYYGYGGGYGGYYGGGWDSGYQSGGYGYGGYDDWGYGGGKMPRRGAAHGGYHPYFR